MCDENLGLVFPSVHENFKLQIQELMNSFCHFSSFSCGGGAVSGWVVIIIILVNYFLFCIDFDCIYCITIFVDFFKGTTHFLNISILTDPFITNFYILTTWA